MGFLASATQDSTGELSAGKKTLAAVCVYSTDRAELEGEVSNISDQLNAYRVSIVSENTKTLTTIILKSLKYRDSKEIQYDLKADCEYSEPFTRCLSNHSRI